MPDSSDMHTSTSRLGAAKTAIRLRHLQQLHALRTLVSDPLETCSPAVLSAPYDVLVDWSRDREGASAIKAAIKNRVYGGPVGAKLDPANVFMAFMESAAMYLRDARKVVEAAKIYCSGDNNEDALRLLESSTARIDELADLWGMEFIQICDGHSWLVGPFCGAFIPKDMSGSSPFIGIVFKGANVNSQEVIDNLTAMSTVRASGWLWGSQVASEFYYPMFSTYDSTRVNMPFVLVQQAVQSIVTETTTTPVISHVTGHSLGGAFASLAYAQLCISGFGTSNVSVSVGDLYTFGSPRVGRSDFATSLNAAAHLPATNGCAWRIVNHTDYVPKLPASLPWPLPGSTGPFVHAGDAVEVYVNQDPGALDSEVGTRPALGIPTAVGPHLTTAYYRSLRRALTGQMAFSTSTLWARFPLTVFPNHELPRNFDAYDDRQFKNSSAATILYDVKEHVVATITVDTRNRFVGQITGLPTAESPSVTSYGSNTIKYKCTSWGDLFKAENKCVIRKFEQTWRLYFVVGDAVAGYLEDDSAAVLADNGLTRGTCVWTFNANNAKLEEIAKGVERMLTGIFEDDQNVDAIGTTERVAKDRKRIATGTGTA